MPQKRDAQTRTVRRTPMVLMIIMSMAVLMAVDISLATHSESDGDKSGTTGRSPKTRDSQVLSISTLASLDSSQAERGGFEPPVPISQDTAFPMRRQSAPRHLAMPQNPLFFSVFRVFGPLRIPSNGDLSKICQNRVRQFGGSCAALLSNPRATRATRRLLGSKG